MCGITGFYTSNPDSSRSLQSSAERMANAIAHRGPDDWGTWADESAGVALGFRRLAILDLSVEGHQPMRSASGRYTLVFNGEVFNFLELRRELEARGPVPFRGHSDTEIMLAAFEAWGIRAAVGRFVGMFAMAVWDAERRSLTLVRDRLGIKPLYVYHTPGYLAFGSELKAIAAGPRFTGEVDPVGVEAFLRYLYIPAPQTIYRNVWKLPPGHLLTIRDPSVAPPISEAYWSLDDVSRAGAADPLSGDESEIVAKFEALLTESVRLRMLSDVPIGALLSGGVDSSLVVAIMQSLASGPVKTFTMGFDQRQHDESQHARAVAGFLQSDHTELRLSGRDALQVVPLLPEMFDEPLADPSQIPTYLVSRLARQHVTVALTGDGGDELFAGYNRYVSGEGLISSAGGLKRGARHLAGAALTTISEEMWDRVHQLSSPLLPRSARVRLAGAKLQKIGRVLLENSEGEQYRALVSFCRKPGALLSEGGGNGDPFLQRFSQYGHLPLLERMQLIDQQQYLPDDLLAKVDRASMAVSLEARVPLLDHRLVEFSWRLPRRYKIRDGQGKWLLKHALYKRVPRELVDRPKVGFTVPIREWLMGPLVDWASDLLGPGAVGRYGVLDPGAVATTWSRFRGGQGEDATGIWAILMLQAWCAQWL